MDDPDDNWKRLVDGARAGREEAWEEMFNLLYPKVRARVSGLLPRREEVDDLMQDVFLRICRSLHQYRGGSFPGWVDCLAKRICYDALRRRRVRPEWRFSDLGFDPDAGSASEPEGEVDAAGIITELFRMLPPEQAWLLQEIELAQRSIGEVSTELGWTAAGGRVRLFRARQALKRIYDKWDEKGRT